MHNGLIFDSTQNRTSGTVWIDLPSSYRLVEPGRRRLEFPRRVFGGLANVLLFVGGAGIILTMLPVAAMEIKYSLSNLANLSNSANLQSPPPPNLEVSLGDLLGPLNQEQSFSVHIPKIDARSTVIPNVDAGNPNEYMEALKKGVAHAVGTGLPGVESKINRTIYLFAHSTSAPSLVTQYNAQFYLLYKLEAGDEVEVTFWARQYRYRVVEKRVVEPEDTEFLRSQTEKELLVLATCWPPGTTMKRLLVLAEREN